MGVVIHPQLIRNGQEQGVGGGDGFVRGKLLDEYGGLGGVRAAEDRAGVRVDVANLVLVASVASEVGPVAVVDQREDAAADRDARLPLVPGLLP